jgi:hypothetical protein
LVVARARRSYEFAIDQCHSWDAALLAHWQYAIFSDEAERTPLAELTEVLIPKKQVLCISASGEEQEARANRLYNFQQREECSVALMVDNYLIEGLAHLPKTATGVAYSLFRSCG